jgi:hypothetical protein
VGDADAVDHKIGAGNVRPSSVVNCAPGRPAIDAATLWLEAGDASNSRLA